MYIREEKIVGNGQQSAVDRLSLDIQLAHAAQTGSKSQVIKLLKKGADRNFRATDGGTTPLHNAAFAGNLDAINVLTEGHLGLIDVPDNDGWSPLHCALTTDRIEAVRLLLQLGANPLHLDTKGNNPLFRAMISLYTSTGLEFLKLVPAHNNTLLNHRNSAGQTLLHVAVEHKSKRWVQALLKLNANTELRDNDDKTPLLLAVSNNADECIEHLLSKPVDITVADNQGQTVLHIALEKSFISLVRLFLSLPSVKTILNKKDSQGITPLMLAASAGKIALIKLLLDAGASVTEVNLGGRNVIQMVEDLLSLLKEKDAMVAVFKTCLTLLTSAIQNNRGHQNQMNGNHVIASSSPAPSAMNKKKKPKKKKSAAIQTPIQLPGTNVKSPKAETTATSQMLISPVGIQEAIDDAMLPVSLQENVCGSIIVTNGDFYKYLKKFIYNNKEELYEKLMEYLASPENVEPIAETFVQKCRETFYLHDLITQLFHYHTDPAVAQSLLKKLFTLMKSLGINPYQVMLSLVGKDDINVIQQVVVNSFAQQNIAAVEYIVREVKSTLSLGIHAEMLFNVNHKGKSVILMASHWENKACWSFLVSEITEVIYNTPANHTNRLIILEKLIQLANQLKLNKKLSDTDRSHFINPLARIVGVNDLALFVTQLTEASRRHDLKLLLITLAPPVSKTPHYGWGFIRQIEDVIKHNNSYFLTLFLQTIDLPDCYAEIKKFVLKEMKTSPHETVKVLYQQYETLWAVKEQQVGRNGFFARHLEQPLHHSNGVNGYPAAQTNGKVDVKQSDIRPC